MIVAGYMVPGNQFHTEFAAGCTNCWEQQSEVDYYYFDAVSCKWYVVDCMARSLDPRQPLV